jgi:hypothetical protein
MQEMCQQVYDHCPACQRNTPRTARPYLEMQRLEQPVEPRTIYAMDFITDLCDCGPSCTPYNMVLVLVDCFSDRVFAWPARKTDTSLDISNLILRKLVHEAGRGYPLDIRCDNDTRFARAVMENLLASRDRRRRAQAHQQRRRWRRAGGLNG